jgi:hypothetical protein
VADTCLANRGLASCCLAIDVYSVVDSLTSRTCSPSRYLAVVICVTICSTREDAKVAKAAGRRPRQTTGDHSTEEQERTNTPVTDTCHGGVGWIEMTQGMVQLQYFVVTEMKFRVCLKIFITFSSVARPLPM